MNELIDSKKQKNRLLIEYRLISTNKKIDYWLSFSQTHELIDFQNKKINYWVVSWRFVLLLHSRKFVLWFRDFLKEFELNVKWTAFIVLKKKIYSFSQIHDHSRWFTIRIMKVKCNHRFQRKNFKLTIFFWLAYFYKWFDDFFLICVSLQMIRRFFLIIRVSLRTYLTILFCLLAYFDEQFTIYRNKTFDRMSISLAKLKTKNRYIENVKMISSSSLQLIKRFRAKNKIVTSWIVLKTKSSQIDNDFVFFYSLIVTITNVKFTSLVTMKIKYNVKRMSRKQIT